MSTVGSALITWDEFVRLEDPEEKRYQLHDRQVALRRPARHIHIQSLLTDEAIPIIVLPGGAFSVAKLFQA